MASPGPDTAGVGGNTSCLEIQADGRLIICDAGTGIRPLGISLLKRFGRRPIRAHILLSHLHLDHYIGLPFFKPLYRRGMSFVIAGPKAGRMGFGEALKKAVNPPFFPVPFSRVQARLSFKTVAERGFMIGKVSVHAMALNHPGGSLGWRFRFKGGRSLVYITDNEPAPRAGFERLVRWMAGADALIHDAQYSPTLYRQRVGWGHSPFTYPLALAQAAGIERLFLFHFDPEDSDRRLGIVLKEARALARRTCPATAVHLAREGLSFTL